MRQATAEDIDRIVEMRLGLLGAHRDNVIYGRTRADAPARARIAVERELSANHVALFVAEVAGVTVGTLRCAEARGSPLLRPSRHGYVGAVFVDPSARRQGVLRAMVAAAESWCRARRLTQLRLHNAADNSVSAAAWQALGFEVIEHLRMREIARRGQDR